MSDETYQRLDVNITDEHAEELRALAQKKGMSVTELIRRAVIVYDFLSTESLENGKKIQLIDDARQEITELTITL